MPNSSEENDRSETRDIELRTLHSELANSLAKEAADAQRIAEIDEELYALRSDLANTRAAYELTSYRLAALMNSTFWRATGPLRLAAGHLPSPVRALIRNSLRLIYRLSWPLWHRFLYWQRKPIQGSGTSARFFAPPGFQQEPAENYRPPLKECRVLFISGSNTSASHIYRVDNMMRGLRNFVAATEAVPLHELWRVIERIADFHVVVFWRVPLSHNFNNHNDTYRILTDCEHHGIAVFDVDDLVFDPEICTPRYIDALRHFQKREMSSHIEGVIGYRDMMLACKNALLATTELKERAEALGIRGFVVPNGLCVAYESALHRSLTTKDRSDIIIGYAPGTRTHQKDFAVAAGALSRLLDEYPQAKLKILGLLDLNEFPELLKRLGQQVYIDESVGRKHVLRFNEMIDICIAPLEMDNPYTSAKSELKYFEAAVFGVPTVASRVGPYLECIKDGKNGFTAATEDEWLTALTLLVSDKGYRQHVGEAARAAVAATYTVKAIAQKMLEAFESVRSDLLAKSKKSADWIPTPDKMTLPLQETFENNENFRGKRPLTINWLVPGLIIGGGGHQNILRAAYHLYRFGHRIRLYFTDTDLPVTKLGEMVREHFYPLQCPMYVYDGTMLPADVVFGTYWTTIYKALQHQHVCRDIFYFVQDFEPMFFPMGSDYIMAENTYRLGLYHITSGPWCADFLRRQYKAEADSFSFPIQSVYRRRIRTKSNKNILFFAKPDMPRRCYQLGIEMLKLVNEARPHIEIILFGSSQISRNNLPFPATCKGLLPTLNDLAEMYSNADLGIVFSPTNPSLVPYEMLSCGLPVVDMDRQGASVNYGDRHDIALLADPVPTVMAKQIIALLDNEEERAQRSAAGVEFAATFPDEESMARHIENLIIERLKSRYGEETVEVLKQEKTGT